MTEDDERTLQIDGAEIDPDSLEWDEVHKRPVQVEAVTIPAPFTVETLEGTMEGQPGDVLIRGVRGEYYPCDAGIFAQTYIQDDARIPKYTDADLKEARREFRENTLDHVSTGVRDTDAREGVRAFLSLLRDQ